MPTLRTPSRPRRDLLRVRAGGVDPPRRRGLHPPAPPPLPGPAAGRPAQPIIGSDGRSATHLAGGEWPLGPPGERGERPAAVRLRRCGHAIPLATGIVTTSGGERAASSTR